MWAMPPFEQRKISHMAKTYNIRLREVAPMENTKTVATRLQILRLKCTKFDFGWGSAPDPAGGAYSATPNPLAGFKGSYF